MCICRHDKLLSWSEFTACGDLGKHPHSADNLDRVAMPTDTQPRAALSPRAILAFAILWSALGALHYLAQYGRVASAVCLAAAFLYALLGALPRRPTSRPEDAAAAISVAAICALQVLSGGTSRMAFGLALVPSLMTFGISKQSGLRWLVLSVVALGLSTLSRTFSWVEPTFHAYGDLIEVSLGLAAVVFYFVSAEGRGQVEDAASLGAMRERQTAERAEELGRLKSEVDSKNAALDALNVELISARNLAEGRAKEAVDFLSHMSHEIRTPLNGVLGITDVLLATKLDAEAREHVKILASSGKLLRRLVDDVLELARLDAGKVQLLEDPFDPVTVAEDVVDLFAAQASAKGVFVFVDPPEMHVERLVGDAMRIRQVIQNLVSNAVKFTQRGIVRVTLRSERNELTYTVEDTGPGLSEQALSSLFREYQQDREGVRRGGSGLGLVIARRLSRVMGGDVSAESEVGRGSTFHARFALRRATHDGGDVNENSRAVVELGLVEPNAALGEALVRNFAYVGTLVRHAKTIEELAAARGTKIMRVLVRTELLPTLDKAPWAHPVELVAAHATADLSTTPHHLQLPARRTRAQRLLRSLRGRARESFIVEPIVPTGRRALLVDDEPVNLRILSLLLKQQGWAADSFGSGREALERAESGRYDIALIDLQMPDVDGLQTATGVIARTKRLPWMVLYSAMDKGVMENGNEATSAAGFVDFLRKPVDVSRLRFVLANAERHCLIVEARALKGLPLRPEGAMAASLRALHVAFALQDTDRGQAILGEMRLEARRAQTTALEALFGALEEQWPEVAVEVLVDLEIMANASGAPGSTQKNASVT